jgi:hypothetical protein
MTHEPRVILCVIARNESTNLPACLASVEGAVDGIVVVDTGSTDDTVAVAEAAGATVVHFPWIDDFAAARNAALPRVPDGAFILLLDADERLAPGAAQTLRAAAADPQLDCGMLPLHNAPSETATPDEVLRGPSTLLPRLLRRTGDLEWRGCIHENVGHWIEHRRERARFVDAAILHYGGTPDVRARLGKAERNTRLLERRIAEDPADPTSHALLGEELLLAGRADDAQESFERAWNHLVAIWEPADGGPPRRQPPPIRILQRYASRLLKEDDLEGASDAVARVIGWVGDAHPVVRFLRGSIEELAGDASDGAAARGWWVRALHSYRACAQAHGLAFTEPVPPECTGAGVCVRLATVLVKLADPVRAREIAEGAIEQHGATVELRCALAEAELLAHAPDRALTLLGLGPHPAPEGPIDTADAHGLAAEAWNAIGNVERAADAARRAAALRDWREPHRVPRLIALVERLGI